MKVLLPLGTFIALGALLHHQSLLSDWFVLIPYTALGLIGLCVSYMCGQMYRRPVLPTGKAVVVTGCDSGCGYHAARALDALGFTVFAGCLDPPRDDVTTQPGDVTQTGQSETTVDETIDQSEDVAESEDGQPADDNAASGQGDTINQSEPPVRQTSQSESRIKFFRLDTTDDDSVQKAVQFVSTNLGEDRLWAFIHCPVFHAQDLIELLPLDAYKAHFDVNCLGLVRVTRAFLPLLRTNKSRIINVLGFQARVSQPGDPAFSMCQHANLAFNDCLRIEMRAFSVKVVNIEAQEGLTELVDVPDETVENGRVKRRQELQQAYTIYEKVVRSEEKSTEQKAVKTVDMIVRAVRSGRPRVRYPVSIPLRIEMWFLAVAPTKVCDWYKKKYRSMYKLAPNVEEPRSRENSEVLVVQRKRVNSKGKRGRRHERHD